MPQISDRLSQFLYRVSEAVPHIPYDDNNTNDTNDNGSPNRNRCIIASIKRARSLLPPLPFDPKVVYSVEISWQLHPSIFTIVADFVLHIMKSLYFLFYYNGPLAAISPSLGFHRLFYRHDFATVFRHATTSNGMTISASEPSLFLSIGKCHVGELQHSQKIVQV
jgi:hypothetical protein